MALIWKDRVKETSTTTGTGTYTLAGAVTGFQAFSAIGNGNTCYYCATDGTDWEVGLGTYTTAGTTLARSSVLASSNSGSAVSWAAGTRYVFVTAPAAWMRKYGPSGMTGMRTRYSSATAIIIEAGGCRDSADAYDLTLAAESTVSIATAGAALGLDETTLTATATTHGTATFEPSASIWSETAMTATVRAATGTITGGGTTITGTGTAFLSELAVGDVIRSSSKGAARVTAIASDTSLTIVAAFPDGNPGGQSFTVYENLTIWPDTAQAGDKRAVNTITDAGTSIVVASSVTSSGAGRPMKIGVEIASRWYFPWIVYGSSGTTAILSTQRTRPYGVTGYTTAWRRIPTEVLNDASGNFYSGWKSPDGGPKRRTYWTDLNLSAPANRVLSAGTATSFTTVDGSGAAPPTATKVGGMGAILDGQAAAVTYNALLYRVTGTSPTYATPQKVYASVEAGINHSGGAAFELPWASAGLMDYKLQTALSAGGAYIDIQHWESES